MPSATRLTLRGGRGRKYNQIRRIFAEGRDGSTDFTDLTQISTDNFFGTRIRRIKRINFDDGPKIFLDEEYTFVAHVNSPTPPYPDCEMLVRF